MTINTASPQMHDPSPCLPVSLSPCLSAPSCSTPLTVHETLDDFFRNSERGVCDTGRYRCRYFSWGRGPALVFVHGICDEAISFVLPIARLKEHFRCIAYDLPTGLGDGARLGRYRHADYVADLLALLDHLHLRQAYIFGSSFGSTITLGALGLAPERFPRAILQGGFARRPLAKAELMLASWGRYWRGTMAALPLRTTVLRAAHSAPFVGREPELWNYCLQRAAAPPMAAVARRAVMLQRLDLRPILPSITTPVLLICGDCDRVVGKKCEEELQHGLPRVARAELENCGHLPQFSHPEVMAEAMRMFLTSKEPRTKQAEK